MDQTVGARVVERQTESGTYFLARLEAAGYLTLVITQNIDMLHERAGSSRVLEVHGNLRGRRVFIVIEHDLPRRYWNDG